MTDFENHLVDGDSSNGTVGIDDSNGVVDVASFLKCPTCHRTTTVSLTIHQDGDVSIDCSACGATAIGANLHESDRTYE